MFTRFSSITPSRGAFDGTPRGWPKLDSDNAKRLQDRALPGSRSYSRNHRGCLEPEAAEGQAFQDAEEPQERRRQGVQTVGPLADHRQGLHRERGRDRFHRRTRRCSRPGHQDRSEWSHRRGAPETSPEADLRLEPAAHLFG